MLPIYLLFIGLNRKVILYRVDSFFLTLLLISNRIAFIFMFEIKFILFWPFAMSFSSGEVFTTIRFALSKDCISCWKLHHDYTDFQYHWVSVYNCKKFFYALQKILNNIQNGPILCGHSIDCILKLTAFQLNEIAWFQFRSK